MPLNFLSRFDLVSVNVNTNDADVNCTHNIWPDGINLAAEIRVQVISGAKGDYALFTGQGLMPTMRISRGSRSLN